MLKNRFVLAGAALLILIGLLVWALRTGRPPAVQVDLLEAFPAAEKRSNIGVENAFAIKEVTIGGETKRSILMQPTSRLIYRLRLPEDAVLRTWIGVDPEAWDKNDSDGVLFRFGITDHSGPEPRWTELVNEYLDPRGLESDRRWRPITVDLTWYGGKEVELIFNTNSSLPGKGDNRAYDLAYWGAPAVYSGEPR